MDIIKYIIKLIKIHKNSSKYWRNCGASIGKNCNIHTSASLGSEPYLVRIGNYVRINENVRIFTHDGGTWVLRNLKNEDYDIDIFNRVFIGNNVHIGSNVSIMPGVKIGNNCIIGVGAIVTKDIPNNSIAVGIPAKVIETIDEYRLKHLDHFMHTKTMNEYAKKEYLLKNL